MIFSVPNSKRVAAIVLVVAVVGSVLLAPGAAAAPATVTASGGTTVQPGETVTVSVTLTNTGSSEDNYIADVSLPDGWTVESHADDGGTWNGGDVSWLWQNLAANSSVTPSLTLAVPDDATDGSATVELTAKSDAGTEDTATYAITVDAPDSEDDGSDNSGSDDDSSDSGGSTDGGGSADDTASSDDNDGETDSGATNDQTDETGTADGSASESEPSAGETVAEQLAATEPETRTDVTIEDTDSERDGVTVDTGQTKSVQELTFDDDSVSGTVEITEYDTPPEAVREQVARGVAEAADSAGGDASDTGSVAEGGGTESDDDESGSAQSAPSVNVVSVTDISPSSESATTTSATVTLTADADAFTDPANAYIAHETADGWERLETTVAETTDGEVTLEAATDSFSLFAVVESSPPPQEPQTDSTSGGVPPILLVAAALAAVVVLGAVALIRR